MTEIDNIVLSTPQLLSSQNQMPIDDIIANDKAGVNSKQSDHLLANSGLTRLTIYKMKKIEELGKENKNLMNQLSDFKIVTLSLALLLSVSVIFIII